MNINRNNYEEYFLLYADNELSKTERKIVEIFVQENPDLKEEFSMWKLTINSPDEKVKLADKSFLLRKESSFINENNYEEIFVLYYDNELPEEQKIETEIFVSENLKFKIQFELIGKARLFPDNLIVYPDKKQLYRKGKSGKVIPLILWRSIAAAVFIGFGLWISALYFNKNEGIQPGVVNANNTLKKPVIPDRNAIPEAQVRENKDLIASTNSMGHGKPKKDDGKNLKPGLKRQKISQDQIAKNNLNGKIEKPFKTQKIPAILPDIDLQIVTANTPIKNKPDMQPHLAEKESQQIDNNLSNNQNVLPAQTASYIEDAGDNNQNYVFYDVPSEKFSKSKVGVFLKKIRRVVERNNPINRLFPGGEDHVAVR